MTTHLLMPKIMLHIEDVIDNSESENNNRVPVKASSFVIDESFLNFDKSVFFLSKQK